MTFNTLQTAVSFNPIHGRAQPLGTVRLLKRKFTAPKAFLIHCKIASTTFRVDKGNHNRTSVKLPQGIVRTEYFKRSRILIMNVTSGNESSVANDSSADETFDSSEKLHRTNRTNTLEPPTRLVVPLLLQVRLRIVFLVAMALFLCNADRTIMSVAIMPLSTIHGWGQGVAGIVQSSFLFGYLLTPIIGGALADQYGGRNVLALGILLWSTATLATPWAAQHSLKALLVARAFMGLGEGVVMPCMNNLMGRWVPPAERARAVGFCFAGFHFGSMGGLLAAPILMSSFNLEVSGPFVVFGLLGYVWLLAWLLVASSSPNTHALMTTNELHYITGKPGVSGREEGNGGLVGQQAGVVTSVKHRGLKGKRVEDARDFAVGNKEELKDLTDSVSRESKTNKEWPPFGLLLSKMPVWALIVANAVNNWGYFIMLSWMPTYFKNVFGVSIRDAAWFSALPWAVMAVSGIMAGSIADALVLRGATITTARKLMQTIGFVGPSLALLGVASASSPEISSLYLTIALGFSAFSQAGFLLNYQDIGPKYAGVLHGMSNTAGTLAGMVSVVFSGFLVDRLGSFKAILWIVSGTYIVGAVFWNCFATGKRVFN